MTDFNQTEDFRNIPQLAERLSSIGIHKKYKAGSTIIQEDSSPASIPIVMKGTLRVVRTEPDGREILLYYLKAGESCVMSVLGGWNSSKSKVRAEVEEDAEILFLPLGQMLSLGREYPEWIEYLFRMYHRRFEELLDMVNAIAFHKMDDRLLSLLYKKAELQKSGILYVTHEQLANELGTVRVVVSRLLKQMEVEGKLSLARNKIRLVGYRA